MDFLAPCLQWLKKSTARTPAKSYVQDKMYDQYTLSYECHGPTLTAFSTQFRMYASDIKKALRNLDEYKESPDSVLDPIVEEIKKENNEALSKPIDGVQFTRQGKDLTVEQTTERLQMIHYASGPNAPGDLFSIVFPKYLTGVYEFSGFGDCAGLVDGRLTEEVAAPIWNDMFATSRTTLSEESGSFVATRSGILHHLDHIQRIQPGDVIKVNPELGEYATFVPDFTILERHEHLTPILVSIENEYAYIWKP